MTDFFQSCYYGYFLFTAREAFQHHVVNENLIINGILVKKSYLNCTR